MTVSLKGKRAVITGGSRGIGAAIVERLARDGADVTFTYVSRPDRAELVAVAARKYGGRVNALHADSGDATTLTEAINRTATEFGGLDILVCNAGILTLGPVDTLPLSDFDRAVTVNVRATFVAIQAAAKHLTAGGRVITIGSCNADRMPFPGGAVYAMTKAALVGLVKGAARDLGPRGITVNNVQPGPVDTDLNPADGPFADALRGLMAMPQFARAEEIAAMVAYLAGSEAGAVTGVSLTIDGGFTA